MQVVPEQVFPFVQEGLHVGDSDIIGKMLYAIVVEIYKDYKKYDTMLLFALCLQNEYIKCK